MKTSIPSLEPAILILLSRSDATMEHYSEVHGWMVEVEAVEARRVMVM